VTDSHGRHRVGHLLPLGKAVAGSQATASRTLSAEDAIATTLGARRRGELDHSTPVAPGRLHDHPSPGPIRQAMLVST
jgi:hypothetical protein